VQLLAFTLEPPQPPVLDIAFAVRVSPQLGQFVPQEAPQPHDIILGELHGRVVGDDRSLDVFDPYRTLLAARRVALASAANEVRVRGTCRELALWLERTSDATRVAGLLAAGDITN
jgi:hypothetical protein